MKLSKRVCEGDQIYRFRYQMDNKVVAFCILLGVLLIAQWYSLEHFTVKDCSGSDCSGAGTVTISTGTLLALLGQVSGSSKGKSDDTDDSTQTPELGDTTTYDSQFKKSLLDEVKDVVKDEVGKARTVMIGRELTAGGTYDGCNGSAGCGGESWADLQGAAFLTTAPGKNPNEYVRKDSIPCWGCSLK